jgi:hypothetical protein
MFVILLTLKAREIPRFAQNDKIICFFRSLFSLRTLVMAGANVLQPTLTGRKLRHQTRPAVRVDFYNLFLISRSYSGK